MKIPNANSIDTLHYFLLDHIVCFSPKTDPWPISPSPSNVSPWSPDPWPCYVSPTPPPPSPLPPLPGSPQVGRPVGCWPVGPSLPPSTHWLPASGCSLPRPPQLPHSWQGGPSMYKTLYVQWYFSCSTYIYLNAITCRVHQIGELQGLNYLFQYMY